jgi:alpha,alpha-trehalase
MTQILLLVFLIQISVFVLWRLSYNTTTTRVYITSSYDQDYDVYDRNFCKNFIKQAKLLYLNKKYLQAVKLAEPNTDSKSIVDRATKKPIAEVLAALANLDERNIPEILNFIQIYLHEPGIEIVSTNLTDWVEHPKFIDSLKSKTLREFAAGLNKIWLDLYKEFDTRKLCTNCVSSHLLMKHPFVVPGGRFIEMYYWDTYWTIEGLLVCGMFDTVWKMLENFIHFIHNFGFIPNGSRVYYLNRSQPPLFTQMIQKFYDASLKSDDLSLRRKQEIENFILNKALFFIIQEYEYWMKHKSVQFAINDKIHILNIYKANTLSPRPESYSEDLETASVFKNELEKQQVYRDIASAAESGYDFSSRWFRNHSQMHTIQTTNIIPVDLNAYFYKNELIITDLCLKKGDYECARLFRMRAGKRRKAINDLLWSKNKQYWCDYDIRRNRLTENLYISNLSPLWVGIRPPGLNPTNYIERFLKLFVEYEGGIPVSFINSTQQVKKFEMYNI